MERKKKFDFARFYEKYGTFAILIVVFAAASLLSPNFLRLENLTNVLRQITVVAILACGMSFVLVSGNINIAYDGLIAFLGCTACLIMARTQNLLLSVGLTLVLGAVVGYLYGVMVTKFQIPAFIVGLAFGSMASGAIMLITGGMYVSNTVLGNFSVLGQGYIGSIPICVIIMIVVVVISHVIMSRSCFGRKVFAVGGNKVAAVSSGINADKTIRQVYLLDGIFLAMGAILYMSRMNHGEPTGGVGYCFDAITAACVGGISISGGSGGIVGTLLGAVIVGILNNLLNLMNVNANWQDVISGLVILVAVTVDVVVKEMSARNMKER